MALKMHLGSLFGGYTMLNNKKIRNMTKLAIDEKKGGKEDLRQNLQTHKQRKNYNNKQREAEDLKNSEMFARERDPKA